MAQLRGEGVDAIGYVDDVAAEFARATALVVPMRMGGGVRFKVLEAMAAGVPVVSTPAGMAGIAAEHERHVLIGRSTAELAAAVGRVLEDRELAGRLSSIARKLVEGRYDWRVITPPYLRLLTAARRTARNTR
jgi:glycosyltransferase involved in cell wall biosynthesis